MDLPLIYGMPSRSDMSHVKRNHDGHVLFISSRVLRKNCLVFSRFLRFFFVSSREKTCLKRRQLERLLLPEEFLGEEVSIYRQDLAALYLLLLLVARYKLSNHKTICYHLFQYLQRIPCWNRLSFPSAPRWVRHSYLSKGLR